MQRMQPLRATKRGLSPCCAETTPSLTFWRHACVNTGFLVAPLAARAPRTLAVQMAISEVAQICIEDGCSVDTVEDLLLELKHASQTSSGQAKAAALEMYSQLKTIAAKADDSATSKSELEKIVAGIGRTFGTVENFEFKGPAVGYSGKPGTTIISGKAFDT